MTNRSSFETKLLAEMERLGDGQRYPENSGDPTFWHEQADLLLLSAVGKRLSPETVEKIRHWFTEGVKWYA